MATSYMINKSKGSIMKHYNWCGNPTSCEEHWTALIKSQVYLVNMKMNRYGANVRETALQPYILTEGIHKSRGLHLNPSTRVQLLVKSS